MWTFIILGLFSSCVMIDAQKFRFDYMWAQTHGTFYRLHEQAANWETARTICEAEGTSLLVPTSIDEMENLKILLSNMKAHFTAIYIGLHDQFSQGDFVSYKGKAIEDTFLELIWSEGKPDNLNGTEDCVIMSREGLLDDVSCDSLYPFLCKILGKDVKYNEECDNYDMEYKLHPNGKCYKFHAEPLSWHDAYLICSSEQGHLAVINSQDEASLVTSFLGEHVISNVPNPNILYVGFSDLMYPYQYRTIFGESLHDAGYASWSPLKEDTTDMDKQHCGAISRTGFLKVTWCEQPAMFLCARKPIKIKKEDGEIKTIKPCYAFYLRSSLCAFNI